MKKENTSLQEYANKFEILAQQLGLDYFPIEFEVVPENFMTEIAVYGLPVRMPHWSYGLRYMHQLIRHEMGNSRIFEVMFPGNPCHAYLVDKNTIAENILVIAHVIGHSDFVKNNHLFANFMKMSGGQILKRAAKHANNIEFALNKFGQDRVENILDAAIALEAHIDINFDLDKNFLNFSGKKTKNEIDNIKFHSPYKLGTNNEDTKGISFLKKENINFKRPEYDLLWFIANYAPDLDGWERDIFLAVREESFYFYPVFACQIMNEGWASYWHACLLREADFIPDNLYISAIKAHSDVVRPYANENKISLSINPYHLGFLIWEDLVERLGLTKARKICEEEDDFGFIRNYLTEQLAEKLNLFIFESQNNETIKVSEKNINLVREAIISPKFNYGSPRIAATEIRLDGSLELAHDYLSDGRGLDLEKTNKVLEYIAKIWKRSVCIKTIDHDGNEKKIMANFN